MEKQENFNNNQESAFDLMADTVEKILITAPIGQNKKEYLLNALIESYGKVLAEEITNTIPESYFIETKTPTEEAKEIITKLETFPEGIKEDKLEEILKKEYEVTPENIKEFKKSPNWKKIFNTTSLIGVLVLTTIITIAGINSQKDKLKNKKKVENIEKTSPKIENTNQRFKKEVYDFLPERGKDIYKYFAEKDPTPDRGYEFLDKDSALMYVFNKNNELIAKIPAGFGKDEGDEQNTSAEYNKGKMTTPAGIYLISNYAELKDIEEYGKLQFSLYGKSVIGDNIFLGQHQTYSKHGEFKPRTEKLNSPTPDDNKFSNGCINITAEDFEKYIKPNFKGDYGEFLFILQDKKSRESGVKFEVESLIKMVVPMMFEMTFEEEKIYQENVLQMALTVNKLAEEIKSLQNNQNKLMQEYQENKDVLKQKEIENIKEKIKNKIGELSDARKILNAEYKKIDEIEKKRKKIEEIFV